jgi:hypothetical protein
MTKYMTEEEIEQEKEQNRKDIAKQYDALFDTLDKKSQEIVKKLIPLHTLLDDDLMYDIKRGLKQVREEGCNKAFIIFRGETPQGEIIEAGEELVVHFEY